MLKIDDIVDVVLPEGEEYNEYLKTSLAWGITPISDFTGRIVHVASQTADIEDIGTHTTVICIPLTWIHHHV